MFVILMFVIFFHLGDDYTEHPLHFEVPLPQECEVAGTGAHTYNQGLCSRRPCHTDSGACAISDVCCFEVSETAAVHFTCSDSHSPNQGHVIVTCRCQPCSQLRAEVSGEVVSSLGGDPVVLATILTGGEVVTFTDQTGSFSFETLTPSSSLTLIIQEARHRELERNVTVHPSLIHNMKVVLEHIEAIEQIDKMEAGFNVPLTTNDVVENYGVDGFLHFPPDAFVSLESEDSYHGSGKVLLSLYCTDKWPNFAMKALSNLVYVDSRGAEFSIQSVVIGTLSVVGEGGEKLNLQVGAPIVVTTSLRIDSNIASVHVSSLHLFSYSHFNKRWLDHGRMSIVKDTSTDKDLGLFYWVTLQGKLRQIHQLWVVGYPLRLSCWVKVQAFQSNGLREEITGVDIQLQQSDNLIGRGSFYQHSAPTHLGVGACLKSVCSLGGVLSPGQGSEVELEAVTPSISNGIIMGSKDEIMIYTVDKQNIGISGKHPFYPSEEACMQHSGVRSGHFRFVTRSQTHLLTRPTILLTESSNTAEEGELEKSGVSGFCYLKVAVLDCAAYSDVKAVSYDSRGKITSVSFEVASVLGGEAAAEKDSCAGGAGVTRIKASCVDFTCGAQVHISAQSRMEQRQTKSCRYWSSTASIPWTIPPSHNLTSFHFTDEGTGYSQGHGVYHALTKELALMKCYSGSHKEPSNTLDPYRGVAVTFTCI